MTISVTGLGSGIDVQSIVSQLMQVAQQPLTALGSKKTEVDAATQTMTSLASDLSALKSAALALTTPAGFSSFGVASSDPSSVGASVVGSATPGSYTVQVTQLAAAQKSRSTEQTSATSALGMSGSLSISCWPKPPVQIQISTTDTLADVASKISSSGARVAASVMSDGSGYRLLVQGLDTGAQSAFTISESGTSFGLADPSSVYQQAADAQFSVDGMGATIPSNQVSGVIAGVTLGLGKVTTTPVTLAVATDPTALGAKVTTLVNAYNTFVTASNAAIGYGSQAASNPLLQSDVSVRSALSQLGSLASQTVSGTTGTYTTLASIGLSTQSDGTLALDTSKLDAALSNDPSTVERLFVTDPVTGATGMMQTLMNTVDQLVSGSSSPFEARITSLGQQSKHIADSETQLQTRLTDYQNQLNAEFNAMDTAVAKYQMMMKQIPGASSASSGSGSSGSGTGG